MKRKKAIIIIGIVCISLYIPLSRKPKIQADDIHTFSITHPPYTKDVVEAEDTII